MRTIGFLIGLVIAVAAPAAGQGRPLQPRGVRDLNFGTVLPGIPRTILRTDPANSGELEVRGERNAQVQFTFTLPAAMTGPGGATMPLAFGASDAGYSATQSITAQTGFDPNQVFLARLSSSGRGSVYLGGTANPGAAQAAGTYSATVTLSVAYTGL